MTSAQPVVAHVTRTETTRQLANLVEFAWVWLALVLLLLTSAVLAPGTIDASSLRLMAPYASVLAVAAIGQCLVIRQRGIDLSVPGVMSFSGVAVAKLTTEMGGNLVAAVLLTCALMALVGAVSGVVITRLGVTPLIATLAMNALLVGAVQSYSRDIPLSAPEVLSKLALGRLLGVPNPAWVALVVVAVTSLVIGRTVAGRRFVAVGENAAAARVAGIRVVRHQVTTYAAAAVCYAVGGMLLAGSVQTAVPDAGNSYLLPVIAAVVVGGTPFTGGRGSVVATAVAAVFLTQLLQVVLALGAPSSTQLIVQSVAIATATGLRYVPWSKARYRRGR